VDQAELHGERAQPVQGASRESALERQQGLHHGVAVLFEKCLQARKIVAAGYIVDERVADFGKHRGGGVLALPPSPAAERGSAHNGDEEHRVKRQERGQGRKLNRGDHRTRRFSRATSSRGLKGFTT